MKRSINQILKWGPKLIKMKIRGPNLELSLRSVMTFFD